VRLSTLPPSCAVVMKSGNLNFLESSGPLQACNGTVLPFYIYPSWTDHVRNEKVLLRVNEQRNILHEIRKRKANWIGQILCRNCLLKQVIEGKIKGEMEVARRRGRRRKKLLDDLKDRRGYTHLKEEALDRTMWRNRFGRGFGPVVRQNTERMNLYVYLSHVSPVTAIG